MSGLSAKDVTKLALESVYLGVAPRTGPVLGEPDELMESNRNRAFVTIQAAGLHLPLIKLAPFFRDWYFHVKGVESTDTMLAITEYHAELTAWLEKHPYHLETHLVKVADRDANPWLSLKTATRKLGLSRMTLIMRIRRGSVPDDKWMETKQGVYWFTEEYVEAEAEKIRVEARRKAQREEKKRKNSKKEEQNQAA